MPDQEQMWREVAEIAFEICSEKEVDFIEDIEERAKEESLTPKQEAWLKRLYGKACRLDERGVR